MYLFGDLRDLSDDQADSGRGKKATEMIREKTEEERREKTEGELEVGIKQKEETTEESAHKQEGRDNRNYKKQ